MQKRRILFGLAALTFVLPALAAAQSAALFSANGPNVTIAGAPFQAKRVGRSVRQQADGTTVTQEVHGQMARDSQGRVRVEKQQGDQPLIVEVLDPVNRTSLRWNSSSATATSSTPFSRPPWHVTFPPQQLYEAIESTAEDKEPENVTKEDLGKKTIDGLVTTGTRTSTTNGTLKLVHEVWFSEDLSLAMVDTFTDSKGGQQTIEIQDVTRAEPDPALFQAPQNYAVKQQPAFALGGGIAGGISLSSGPLPPPPPPPPPSPGQTRIKVAESPQAAIIINRVAPQYPPLARQAGVQGTVVLHAVIDRDGKIAQLLVLSGHPLLIQAALVAVRQWTYKPTLLDGKPVEVETTISVPFVLDDKP